jgi:general secretion pathway protein A
MYLDFYQLKRAPFHLTSDPEFLFLSPSHKAALGTIMHGIAEGYGFVAIVGKAGVGKTTIIRAYLETADQQQLKMISIVNANVSPRGLLKTILREFGDDFEADDPFDLINRLHQILLEEYEQGRKVALIIDEVQNMPVETLDHLRILSNLETPTEKLLQIVFVGQPELQDKLDLKELRSLKQRVVLRVTLEPLTDEQSLAYIYHRLAKAATTLEPIFTQGALKLIVATAKGTPRILNTLCTNALIAGFGYRQKPIPARTVREVINHLDAPKNSQRLRYSLAWALALIVCAGAIGVSREKLNGVGSTVVTYFMKPQQTLTQPQRGVLGSGISGRTIENNPRDNHVTTTLNVTSTQESQSRTEQINSNRDATPEHVKSMDLPEKTQQDDDRTKSELRLSLKGKHSQNPLRIQHSW